MTLEALLERPWCIALSLAHGSCHLCDELAHSQYPVLVCWYYSDIFVTIVIARVKRVRRMRKIYIGSQRSSENRPRKYVAPLCRSKRYINHLNGVRWRLRQSIIIAAAHHANVPPLIVYVVMAGWVPVTATRARGELWACLRRPCWEICLAYVTGINKAFYL